jgi:hypothetical protein
MRASTRPSRSESIDWNADGTSASPPQDVNYDGHIDDASAALSGANDWANLRLNQIGARRAMAGFSGGFLGGYVDGGYVDGGYVDGGYVDGGYSRWRVRGWRLRRRRVCRRRLRRRRVRGVAATSTAGMSTAATSTGAWASNRS